jgi:hypothetical protein
VRGVGSRTDPAPISREKVRGAEVGLELDVEEGDVIAASLAVAGRDQLVELGIGSMGSSPDRVLGCCSSAGRAESIKGEWGAADLAALEASDRAVDPHDSGVLVEFDDDAVDAVQVAGARVTIDLHSVTDVEHRERFMGGDRVQKLVPCPDRVGDCDQVRVKRSGGDLVKEEPLRLDRFFRRPAPRVRERG